MRALLTGDQIEAYFSAGKNGAVYRCAINDTERVLIEKALVRSAGNQVRAAKILGINRNTLRTKIRRLHIDIGQLVV